MECTKNSPKISSLIAEKRHSSSKEMNQENKETYYNEQREFTNVFGKNGEEDTKGAVSCLRSEDNVQQMKVLINGQCKSIRSNINHNKMVNKINNKHKVGKDCFKNLDSKSNNKLLFMLKSSKTKEKSTLAKSIESKNARKVLSLEETTGARLRNANNFIRTSELVKICENLKESSITLPEQFLNDIIKKGKGDIENFGYIISADKDDISERIDYKNIIFPNSHTDDSITIDSFSDFEEIFCIGDYSNKVLIINKDGIEVVTKSSLDNEKKVFFVLNNSAIKRIQNQEYHLDDLQYDLAKAMGIEPERLKLMPNPKLASHLKKGYTNVHLTKMKEPFFSQSKKSTAQDTIKYIEVEMQNLEFEDSTINVAIHNLTHGSEWLGGYRDFKNDIYYHNATTQTEPRSRQSGQQPPWYNPPVLSSRLTQTHPPYKDVGINLPKDRGTQMWRLDHYIRRDTDVILEPRFYVPFRNEITDDIRDQAAVAIQKCWKGYKVRKYDISGRFFSFLQHRKEREAFLTRRFSEVEEGEMEVLTLRMLDMIFPHKHHNFYHLHWLLSKFKADCEKVKNNFSLIPSKKQSDLIHCLEKEFDILLGIQRRKILNKYDALQIERKTFFEKSAVPPCKPNLKKEVFCLIHSYGTERCKEFKELYLLFKRDNLSVEQRIEILMFLKQLLHSYEIFEMKDQLFNLMDRECLMLSTGMDPIHLSYLRKWEEEILLHFLKNHECFKLKPNLRTQELNEILRCKICRKFKNIIEYSFHLGLLETTVCKSCSNKYWMAKVPKSFSPYNKILQQIRETEYSRNCRNPYVSLLQPKCIQHIVQNIWGGRSIFTHVSTPSLLRLPRWQNHEPWAPWNCILLTKDEAELHASIENVYEFYGEEYCQIIKYRLLMALKQFRALIDVENKSRIIWQKLPFNVYSPSTKILQNSFAAAGDTFFNQPPDKKFVP